jgi:two-component system LytT family response regulator
MNGFEVLEHLDMPSLPRVVFVTAYDTFAIKAFEVHALDYLLKPFDQARFDAALERAVASLSAATYPEEKMRAFLRQVRGGQEGAARLLVRERGRVVFINTADIRLVQSEEKYVRIHTAGKTLLHRSSLHEMETKLDKRQFFRVHRTAIVNVSAVTALEPDAHGDYLLVLEDGTRQKLGRAYRDAFLRFLEEEDPG